MAVANKHSNESLIASRKLESVAPAFLGSQKKRMKIASRIANVANQYLKFCQLLLSRVCLVNEVSLLATGSN